jgi:hypothetical protein
MINYPKLHSDSSICILLVLKNIINGKVNLADVLHSDLSIQDSPSHRLCSSILVVYIWMNQNATCQQDSPLGNWSYASFEQYQYIYIYMYYVPKFQTIYTATYNTDPDTTTTTSVVVVVVAVSLLSLLQAAYPWPASSSDSIFQTRTVFCLKNKSFAFWDYIVHSSSSLRLILLTI